MLGSGFILQCWVWLQDRSERSTLLSVFCFCFLFVLFAWLYFRVGFLVVGEVDWLQDRSERYTLLMGFLVGVWLQDRQEKDAADVSVLVFGYRIGRRKKLLMFQCW